MLVPREARHCQLLVSLAFCSYHSFPNHIGYLVFGKAQGLLAGKRAMFAQGQYRRYRFASCLGRTAGGGFPLA